jgi:hypothetical protein
MNDIFRSPIDIKLIGSLYHSVCVSCGKFLGASPSLGCLKMAERHHHCRPSKEADNGPSLQWTSAGKASD